VKKEKKKDMLECISKTKAKEQYLLSEERLNSLPFRTVRNKNVKFARNDVRLYLLKHVKQTAIQIYGSLEKLQEEKIKRFHASDERKRKQLSKRASAAAAATSSDAISEVIQNEIRSLRREILGGK
jgi:hypothetical protein